jgi:hypothetical protein
MTCVSFLSPTPDKNQLSSKYLVPKRLRVSKAGDGTSNQWVAQAQPSVHQAYLSMIELEIALGGLGTLSEHDPGTLLIEVGLVIGHYKGHFEAIPHLH